MSDDVGMRVLDVRLANVEEAIMEMKESQGKIGDALHQLVVLATKHEEHRSHIEKRLEQLDEQDDRLRSIEVELSQVKLVKRGALAAVGLVVSAAFAFVWQTVTGTNGGF
jgi:hypothetical protein